MAGWIHALMFFTPTSDLFNINGGLRQGCNILKSYVLSRNASVPIKTSDVAEVNVLNDQIVKSHDV